MVNAKNLSHDMLSNEALMLSWYEGNEYSLGILCRRLQPALVDRAYYRLPAGLAGKREIAEDLTAECLAKAARTRYRPQARWNSAKSKLMTWLAAILANEIASFLRRKAPKSLLATDLAAKCDSDCMTRFDNSIPDYRLDPAEELAELKRQQRLGELVKQLPEPDRNILVMYVEKRATLAEIGGEHGISKAGVHRRLRKIGSTLAGQIEELPRYGWCALS